MIENMRIMAAAAVSGTAKAIGTAANRVTQVENEAARYQWDTAEGAVLIRTPMRTISEAARHTVKAV